ncbi:hypothetical protein DTO166G4_8873 [Paecilomyces variotii]|nr:hypothetical protein DTO166G4_8873 [Paecilomyces variotii]KAJ9227934.1 hypothetical protein DTO166G5_9005 [Paecilomyces variotii]KAJ9254303.1 hypothetical protein DTO195F2_6668 [Paecilomyces variotii]KAJ9306605.1 hypothetical protein DTO217A2_3957 [Paecilomyces variotii]KAJ9367477.1 hypothetical protein DTO282E5_7850 [Paecilomyces variotii]
MRKLDNPGNITTLTNPPFDITDDDSDDVVSMVTPTPGRDMLHDKFALLLRVSWAIDTTNCITYRQSCSAKQRKTSKRIHT